MGISATLPNVQVPAACTWDVSNAELSASTPRCAVKTAFRAGQRIAQFCSEALTASKHRGGIERKMRRKRRYRIPFTFAVTVPEDQTGRI
jgi:hypothetical protein